MTKREYDFDEFKAEQLRGEHADEYCQVCQTPLINTDPHYPNYCSDDCDDFAHRARLGGQL
jgi:hypothetical protein